MLPPSFLATGSACRSQCSAGLSRRVDAVPGDGQECRCRPNDCQTGRKAGGAGDAQLVAQRQHLRPQLLHLLERATEVAASNRALHTDMLTQHKELGAQMLTLHEEVISRMALLQEGRKASKKKR